MSTIADYSVFTKAFLASGMTDFSQLYGELDSDGNWAEYGLSAAFAVVPLNIDPPLTPREAMNFDLSSVHDLVSLDSVSMYRQVSCRDANGEFIGNIVRVQPNQRNGSIRFVAKVAVPDFTSSDNNPADAPYNTFVLVRTDASMNANLPIAVATISEGYNLHKHKVVTDANANFADPLDDVENANYVSFTINNLNGYTSVDFNPDAYATYDDVANALSRGIDGLHIAFDTASGDLKLLDKDGNVLDQANLPIKTDVIIAEGEEGYKYVKTDVKQDIHAAKAWMPEGFTAWDPVKAVPYTVQHAALVEGSSTGEVVGITLGENLMYTFEEGAEASSEVKDISGHDVTWFGTKDIPEGYTLKYGLEAFVWTVKDAEDGGKISDPFFNQLNASLLALGFHEGDDIALGTNLSELSANLNRVDAEEYIHGKDNKAIREEEVDAQRANAKEELVAWNAQHPDLTENRQQGTIIDSSGLDVRDGRITLGCGRIGKDGEFQKVNYGIQMRERFGFEDDPSTHEFLDFTISHHIGLVEFDENGHAAQTGGNGGFVPLTSSTLLSIEAGSYISGAPTCLILAEVTRDLEDSPNGPTMLTPVRMTAGFSVKQSYDASSGLTLTIHDYRDNIKDVLDPGENSKAALSIIEVQAIYTHPYAQNETVPAQQMHTYIGSWVIGEQSLECSFLCNKIEEWMTAVGLDDTAEGVKLYVVIRVY